MMNRRGILPEGDAAAQWHASVATGTGGPQGRGAGGEAGSDGGLLSGAGGLHGTSRIIFSVSPWPGAFSPLPMSGSSVRCGEEGFMDGA